MENLRQKYAERGSYDRFSFSGSFRSLLDLSLSTHRKVKNSSQTLVALTVKYCSQGWMSKWKTQGKVETTVSLSWGMEKLLDYLKTMAKILPLYVVYHMRKNSESWKRLLLKLILSVSHCHPLICSPLSPKKLKNHKATYRDLRSKCCRNLREATKYSGSIYVKGIEPLESCKQCLCPVK